MAWFSWHGAAAFVLAALLLAEVLITARDEAVENRIRVLPQNERVLHVFLTLNLGAIIALAVPLLLVWSVNPTGLAPHSFGLLSWLLTLLAAFAALWSARDFLAWQRLRRA